MECHSSRPSALIDLADAERQLKALRATSALFGLLNVDDEFFIIIRPAPGGSQLLLSDATAAVDYDIAVDVLDALNLEVPTSTPTTSTMSNRGRRVTSACWPISDCPTRCWR